MEAAAAGSTVARKTLNNMGFMFNYNDEYVAEFIHYAGTAEGTIADLGCAFGVTTKRILKAGAKDVIANDLFEAHLKILTESLTEKEKALVRTIPGSALDLGNTLSDNSLAGILAASWLHFLPPEDFRQAFNLFFKLLRPNGKLCVIAGSTYNCLLEESFDIFEKRKVAGDEWPGLWTTDMCTGTFKNAVPDSMLFADPDILEREAKLAGFVVNKVGFVDFDMTLEGLHLDGRECSGLIAIKPDQHL